MAGNEDNVVSEETEWVPPPGPLGALFTATKMLARPLGAVVAIANDDSILTKSLVYLALGGVGYTCLYAYTKYQEQLVLYRAQPKVDLPWHFDRPTEHRHIVHSLDKRRLVVVVGPPRSGKTAVITKATREAAARGPTCRPLLHYDLADAAFADVQGLARRLTTPNPLEVLYNVIKGATLAVSGSNPEFDGDSSLTGDESMMINRIRESLRMLSYRAASSNAVNVIENLQAMFKLFRDGEVGNRTLVLYLNWLKELATQDSRVTVAISTTGDFFFDWFHGRIFNASITVVGVGDLSREEATRYYEKMVSERLSFQLHTQAIALFDDVYAIVGGSMADIDLFVDEYELSNGTLNPANLSAVGVAQAKICRALHPDSLTNVIFLRPPTFTREDTIKMYKAFTSAEEGFITLQAAQQMVEWSALSDMLHMGLLQYRPMSPTWVDCALCRENNTVGPIRPLERYAMKRVMEGLKEVGEGVGEE
eukprot:comp20441_c0_seq1/m.25982 comp20441_c0_seq1/g.25982  ORF comp20441_c0_seq1/g.25982 comp20441_c0_seq1/m.25982 type:complete len:479 (-) comp20441_c0_seq1:331-1767(-)